MNLSHNGRRPNKAFSYPPTGGALEQGVKPEKQSETVTLYLATGLRRAGPGGGVGHEEIVVHEIPLAEVGEWLEGKARAGVLVDPKVYAGLYFLERRRMLRCEAP